MPPLEFDGFIDLGKELSILHSLLVESLDKMNEVRQTIINILLENLKKKTQSPNQCLT